MELASARDGKSRLLAKVYHGFFSTKIGGVTSDQTFVEACSAIVGKHFGQK